VLAICIFTPLLVLASQGTAMQLFDSQASRVQGFILHLEMKKKKNKLDTA